MAQTEVLLLLILATAAFAYGLVIKSEPANDFDKIVKDAVRHRPTKSKCLTCCPFGWVLYGGRCFLYQATKMDWASAEKHCQNLGAHLVSVHSEHEYQLVKAIARAHDPQESSVWLGLSACQMKNIWFWSDGAKFTYTRWNPYEPNFINGECCVLMNYQGLKNWIDAPCEWKHHFVCATRHT